MDSFVLDIRLKDTPKETDSNATMVCTPSGISFIAVHIPATAVGDYIDPETKRNGLNITQSHEVQALFRKPTTWPRDVIIN